MVGVDIKVVLNSNLNNDFEGLIIITKGVSTYVLDMYVKYTDNEYNIFIINKPLGIFENDCLIN